MIVGRDTVDEIVCKFQAKQTWVWAISGPYSVHVPAHGRSIVNQSYGHHQLA